MHSVFMFFFNNTATTEIYTLSLHDALPICQQRRPRVQGAAAAPAPLDDQHGCRGHRHRLVGEPAGHQDRKSTRLNSSHANISYAVFCLKKKTKTPATSSHDPQTKDKPELPQ